MQACIHVDDNFRVTQSYKDLLEADPESGKYAPNTTSRQVKSGHYVPVSPTPLPDPELIISSADLQQEMMFDINKHIGLLSGEQDPAFHFSWATPYALAIYGNPYFDNCPFGNGRGYGDGRAISVAEIVTSDDNSVCHQDKRWELQLKGSGCTPFSRQGDGRATLRSNLREFLASEAMHHLGVKTTRSLSVVVSNSEIILRGWFAPGTTQRKNDTVIQEKVAMLCRVASSFIRVGHLDLFARRARGDVPNILRSEREQDIIVGKRQLQQMIDFTMKKEFPEAETVLDFLRHAGQKIAHMTADWIRVGFCQGNFNSDNCLVNGVQMDYGPFGFIEKYHPKWNMWTNGGEHFSFMNQMMAGWKNFETLVNAVTPILSNTDKQVAIQILDDYSNVVEESLTNVWMNKLGFKQWTPTIADLVSRVLILMEKTKVDYTIFWRLLINAKDITVLEECFYEPICSRSEDNWNKWLHDWLQLNPDPELMKITNPVYVPREWMLVEAYTKANAGDYSMVHELHELFKNPYYDGDKDNMAKYFRKADDKALNTAGTAYMTCSS